MKRLAFCLPIALGLMALSGCGVAMRSYRTAMPVVAVDANSPPFEQGSKQARPTQSSPTECDIAKSGVCLGFVEVDDMGAMFDAGELQAVLKTIERANMLAGQSPDAAPMVVGFVHGWNHNASETDSNVAGFKEMLERLWSHYGGRRKVIGVYVGWRGLRVKRSWPLAMQLSFFDREAAAVRIPGASLSGAFAEIALRTHENPSAQVVFMGHSFGALLLERSLAPTMASALMQQTEFTAKEEELAQRARELEAEALSASSGGYQAHPAQAEIETLRTAAVAEEAAAEMAAAPRADLVIFVNTAAAASESIQLMDQLSRSELRYQPSGTVGRAEMGAVGSADRPLFVSVTSTVDAVTKLAMPIGHGAQYFGLEAMGSFRDSYPLACFDPDKDKDRSWSLATAADGARRERAYYMITAPHMPVLQSHLMLKSVGPGAMRVSSTGEILHMESSGAISKCAAELFDKSLGVVSTFRLPESEACYAIAERPGRCNGTPYWAMEVDPDVLYDHSDIFTARFMSFLIDSFFQTPLGPLTRENPLLMGSGR